MNNEELAILGAQKAVTNTFQEYNPIGNEELKAATNVIESGVLSKFLGCWDPDFYGGPKVQEFEKQCEKYFNVKHAITVNSWTSGLIVAVGAIGIEPGDEIIVSPWTMCASATAILHWNAIPVFADIEPETFCLDPISIESNITPYTKAIMVVDIFGHSADMEAIMEIAKCHNLKVINDTAQAPGAYYKGRYAGTMGHVGGFSLNYHKHIHTGEGGILVTNDDEIAERLRLIRNHGEAVVGDKGFADLTNMVGYNFRLGEIECAIGIEQLKKLSSLVQSRQDAAEQLTEGLRDLAGLRTPIIKRECTHVYYDYSMVLDIDLLGISRTRLIEALESEGVIGIGGGYANVHLLPMYKNKIAYGSKGFPWTSEICKREVVYEKGICPISEELHDSTYLSFSICMYEMSAEDVELIIDAFKKVWSNIGELR